MPWPLFLPEKMLNTPPPPPNFIAFFGGYMPHKSTICHRGDIFVHPKTMRCKRCLNAFYGHPFVSFFFELEFRKITI
jgi:hypothetical protein